MTKDIINKLFEKKADLLYKELLKALKNDMEEAEYLYDRTYGFKGSIAVSKLQANPIVTKLLKEKAQADGYHLTCEYKFVDSLYDEVMALYTITKAPAKLTEAEIILMEPMETFDPKKYL